MAIDVVGHDRLAMTVRSAIPVARGLGSSAALAVAAAAAAGSRDPLGVAARIDGHPENAAASAVGGLVAATLVRGAVRAVRLPLDVGLVFVAMVPDRPLPTTKARQALPLEVSRTDATFNLGRMSLLLAGLADRDLMIREATEDRLHQDYRSPLFPEAPQLLARLVKAGALASCWSGAGPTLLGICDGERRRSCPVQRRGGHGGDRRPGSGPAAAQRPRGPHRRGLRVTRTFHIRTFGCQMNDHDSERLAGLLIADGLEPTDDVEQADVVLLNTCCIRENADNKLYGYLGWLKSLRDTRPGMQIAVGGCLAQKDRDIVRRRAGHVDVVFGTHNLTRAPALLRQAAARGPGGGDPRRARSGGRRGPPPGALGAGASSPTRPGSPSRWGATTRAPSASCPRCAGPRSAAPSTTSWPRYGG